jgi:dGTPase
MSHIDFRSKINWHRRYRSPQGSKSEHEILRIFESDRGRIINSPAIRRLQQKTQVYLGSSGRRALDPGPENSA